MYLPDWLEWKKNSPKLTTICTNLGGFLSASIAVSVVWELTVKRNFLYEIFSISRLSADIQQSGLYGISSIFYPLPWEEYFKKTKVIEVFITYGNTWRNSNASCLRAFAQTNGTIRVVLPDPNNASLVEELAKRYSKTPAVLKAKIEESINGFNDLLKNKNCVYELRLTDIAPMFCIYSFDGTKIVTLFTQRVAQHDVPTLIMGDRGSVAEFFTSELEDVIIRSTQQP